MPAVTLVAVLVASMLGGAAPTVFAADDIAADGEHQAGVSAPKDGVTVASHCTGSSQRATFSGGTSWHLCLEAVSRFGLIVRTASFRKSADAASIRVLYDGRLSEIFVPYHSGSPRFFDVSSFDFPLVTLTPAHCPAPRTIVAGGTVCREIRDRGIAWMHDAVVRRGQELVLWGVLNAANYNYVIEWSFRDDGSIGGRAGSTGPKLGGPDDTQGHMHNFTWRLDIDLDGGLGDSAFLRRHVENLDVSPSTGADTEARITVEGGRKWSPTGFTTLEVRDARLRNGRGRRTAYELLPLRSGSARHTEPYTMNDVWVTRAAEPPELSPRDLPSYVDGESVANTDIVVWYTASAHHENGMRDEDRDVVPVLWTGFDLIPINLFDRTPLYP
jgi:primary-amine oxidase